MNRLVKQSLAAAATLMLASAAHASLVTYDFTGMLTIGPMGDLAEPQPFSVQVSFHDNLRDRDRSQTHGQYVDRNRSAVFETHIGDQDFIVRGGRHGEIDVDLYNNDPSVGDPWTGGGADGLGIFAANELFSMGFFQLYDSDVFHNDRIPSFTPPLSGAGGFFIDEGAGGIFSGFFDSFTCTTCEKTNVPEPGTLALAAAGLLMLGGVAYRRRKALSPQRRRMTFAVSSASR